MDSTTQWRASLVFEHDSPPQWAVFGPRTPQRFNGDLIAKCDNQEHAKLLAAAPEMRHVLNIVFCNAGESPEWIRARIWPILDRVLAERLIAQNRGAE